MSDPRRSVRPERSVHPQRSVRIAIVVDRFEEHRGGAERALFQLGRFLRARGHDVRAFALAGDAHTDAAELVLVPRFPRSPRALLATRGVRERRTGAALVAAAERAGCDVILGVRHLARVDVLWTHGGAHAESLAAKREAERSARELAAVAPATLLPWSRHRAFLALEREAVEGGARRVICPSERTREELLRHHPSAGARLVTIENGVDLDAFHPRRRGAARAELEHVIGAADGAVIGCAARNFVLKGVPTLLAALARLHGRRWTAVIAGSARAKAWERRARDLGIAPGRVRFVEHVEPATLAAACDLAVLPTWRDTCGLFVLEALACGTPAITTERAGAADALRDPEAGTVLARAGDAELLAGAIAAWLERVDSTGAGTVDRGRVRAAVADRALDPWLERVERVLLDVADEKRAERRDELARSVRRDASEGAR